MGDSKVLLFPTNTPSNNPETFKPSYSYNLNIIYSLTKSLGWPWKESKTCPFSSNFKYLGFTWDLILKTVQIHKKSHYLTKLLPWAAGSKFTCHETKSIIGTLVHCSLAIPDGRSRLPSISRFATSFNNDKSDFISKPPNASVLSDVAWWQAQLSLPFAGSSLKKPPPQNTIKFWGAHQPFGVLVLFSMACGKHRSSKTIGSQTVRILAGQNSLPLSLVCCLLFHLDFQKHISSSIQTIKE